MRSVIRALALIAVLVTVVGCSGSDGGSSPGRTTPAVAAAGTQATGGHSAGAGTSGTVPAGRYRNPVVEQNMPDPAVLQVGEMFHLYTTQGNGSNVQTATSSDLLHWTPGPDALPQLGGWARTGSTWAPEVVAVGGLYALFYTATDSASGKQCVGRAVASTPQGPFQDKSAKAFVCRPDLGGDIDPNPVVIGGRPYLYWKNDGNCCGLPVQLWGQQMNASATALTGAPVKLLANTQPWQGNLVEAPEMVAHDGRYFLFYSANDYGSTAYAEGVATCTAPLGPCSDTAAPLLKSTDSAAGPGHGFVFAAGGKEWILYHAWRPDAIGSETPGRQLWLDPLTWDASGPRTAGPTAAAQPVPLP